MLNKYGKRRSGSAVVVALAIATVLLMAEGFLMTQTQQQIKMTEQQQIRLQAWFAARGVMQHAMLKCQLMPTQLYDAAAFSVGKNPLFDFTEYDSALPAMFPTVQVNSKYLKLASNLNPGPRFLTTFPGSYPTTEYEKWTKIAQFHANDLVQTSNVSAWPKDKQGNDIANPSLYLHKFYADIKFTATADSAMAANQFDFPNGYPYDFDYSVDNLEVVAVQDQRKYNDEAVRLTVKGKCKYRNLEFEQTLSNIIRIKRN